MDLLSARASGTVFPLAPTARRQPPPPRHLADLTPAERVSVVVGQGMPAYRAKQLATHYFRHLTVDPAEMTDLPAAARDALVTALLPALLTPRRRLTADGGATVKTLWQLFDGARVESVLMRYSDRATLCVSSQAGCGMGCPFCATGQGGLVRNLSAAEIVEQVRTAARALADGQVPRPPNRPDGAAPPKAARAASPDAALGAAGADRDRLDRTHLSNVVFMGMGEPLSNYRAVLAAVRTLIAPVPDGLGLSARNITMSTVGLIPAIRRLAGEGMPLTLALSLHAPDDELRDQLVPINARWPVDQALDAARDYFAVTGRRVSIEYALIRGMNDQGWRAELLAAKLNARGRGWVHVNPIPLNPTAESLWTASKKTHVQQFVSRLRQHGIPTTIRDTRGSDIDGACGQLAAEEDE